MVLRTAVEVEDGRVVVRQIAAADDPRQVEELRAKAARLEAAAGPGVVRVLRVEDGGPDLALVTEHAGLPVDAARLGSADGVAAAVAQVAAALERLHAAGRAHGALRAEHVLVGRGGEARLCGLRGGTPDPAADLLALGTLLLALVDGLPPATARAERARRDELRALGLALRDEQPSRRPSPRRVAAALRPARAAAPAAAPGPARQRSVPVALVVAVVLAVALLGVVLVQRSRQPGASASPTAPAPAAPATSTSSSSSTSSTTTLLPAPCVAAAGRPVDAARCGHAAEVDGPTVAVDGRRAVVGRPGDVVLVGDWGCEGEPRAAVLRPSTGEVLVYAPLADGAAPALERAERIEGGVDLVAATGADGCAALSVVTAEGTIRLT